MLKVVWLENDITVLKALKAVCFEPYFTAYCSTTYLVVLF